MEFESGVLRAEFYSLASINRWATPQDLNRFLESEHRTCYPRTETPEPGKAQLLTMNLPSDIITINGH